MSYFEASPEHRGRGLPHEVALRNPTLSAQNEGKLLKFSDPRSILPMNLYGVSYPMSMRDDLEACLRYHCSLEGRGMRGELERDEGEWHDRDDPETCLRYHVLLSVSVVSVLCVRVSGSMRHAAVLLQRCTFVSRFLRQH